MIFVFLKRKKFQYITSFKYVQQGVTLALLWIFLMTSILLLIMPVYLKWWIYKATVKVHVTDVCFKYTHPKITLQMLEARDVRIAMGGCDNSEISWNNDVQEFGWEEEREVGDSDQGSWQKETACAFVFSGESKLERSR